MRPLTITTAQRQAVAAYAKTQVGKPYEWLGNGPDGFDGSGLTLEAWAQVRMDLPHQCGAQATTLHTVPYSIANKKKLLIGDIVFYYGSASTPVSISHCAVYVGVRAGLRQVVEAVDAARGVMQHGMYWALTPSAFGYVAHV